MCIIVHSFRSGSLCPKCEELQSQVSRKNTELVLLEANITCLEIEALVFTGDIDMKNGPSLKPEKTKEAGIIGQLNKQIEDLTTRCGIQEGELLKLEETNKQLEELKSRYEELTTICRIQQGGLGEAAKRIDELGDIAESNAIKKKAMLGACVLVAGICAAILLKKK